LGQRKVSDKKLRKTVRNAQAAAETKLEKANEAQTGSPDAE
jgi:hypothetical protein